jgi:hypothetical protein
MDSVLSLKKTCNCLTYSWLTNIIKTWLHTLIRLRKMEKKSEFNLSKILDETTSKLKKAFPDAQKYILELSKEELQTRLTQGQALEVAETLLKKIGVEADS